MPRVEIRIYDEDSGEDIAREDSYLFEDEEEIAAQAFRVQQSYFNKLEAYEA